MPNNNTKCLICGGENDKSVSFGEFQLSQKFIEIDKRKEGFDNEEKYNYEICECRNCNFFWMKSLHPYLMGPSSEHKDLRVNSNEPEHHFELLINWIKSILENKKLESIGIVSYKDYSLANFFNEKDSLRKIFDEKDLLELSKNLLYRDNLLTLNPTIYPKYDLIFARHILEHLINPAKFIESLISRLNDEGFIYLEVPSPHYMFSKGLSYLLWEEHYSYFTTKSMVKLAEKFSLKTTIKIFENQFEPIICILLSKRDLKIKSDYASQDESLLSVDLMKEIHQQNKSKIKRYLDKKEYENLYFLGAGHLGTKAIAFYELAGYFKGFVDDMITKQNKYVASSMLKVYSSKNIESNSTLIHALPPDSAKRIESNPIYKGHDLISLYDLIK